MRDDKCLLEIIARVHNWLEVLDERRRTSRSPKFERSLPAREKEVINAKDTTRSWLIILSLLSRKYALITNLKIVP